MKGVEWSEPKGPTKRGLVAGSEDSVEGKRVYLGMSRDQLGGFVSSRAKKYAIDL